MALSSLAESLEPMQVDAAEENDNDGDIGIHGGGGGHHANGLPVGVGGVLHGAQVQGGPSVGGLPRGELHGEDSRVFYNVENPTIDLEAYAQGYTGLACLYRLRFIAHHCPMLRVEALKLAMSHVMNTYNTALYSELHRKLMAATSEQANQSGASSSSNLPDVASNANSSSNSGAGNNASSNISVAAARDWVETKNKKAALKLEKLDTDLKNYKSNSIKESIRRGHDDLGDHFLDCGDLANALKCYSRARDYCTSGRHVVNMCVNVIKVSVYLQNWSHVVSYVNKAVATPDFNEGNMKGVDHQQLITRLACAFGLAELATHKYKSAAKHFLQANLDHCDIPDLMSTQNVATYGGLCALATFERSHLHKQVLASPTFKLFLELDPALREVIISFYESKYGKCLKLLEDMKDNLLLDIYLASHVNTLYSMIRSRSLVQYFSPYLSADLRLMASSFNTTVSSLEDELMSLILEGKIQARIDSHNKVLFAQDIDQRSVTFERAIQMGKLYQERSRMMILRSAILKNNIVVKTQNRASANNDQADGNYPQN